METQTKQDVRKDQIVRLKSFDGKIFAVEEAVAFQSVIIKYVAEYFGTEDPILVPSVSTDILKKIIKYCEYHVDHPLGPWRSEEDVDPWYVEFVNLDLPTLIELGLAAMKLNIATLLDLVCLTIAGALAALKTPEKVRAVLNIENDLSPQDVQAIKHQAPWAFDN